MATTITMTNKLKYAVSLSNTVEPALEFELADATVALAPALLVEVGGRRHKAEPEMTKV